MSQTPIQSSADLILKLYELRRDPALREARKWFSTQFRPGSAADILALLRAGAAPSAHYRMVTTYWEMASAMVNHGAIDAALFTRSNGEHIAFFSLIEPCLEEFRAMTREPDYLAEWERLIRSTPGTAEKLVSRRKLFAGWTVEPQPLSALVE